MPRERLPASLHPTLTPSPSPAPRGAAAGRRCRRAAPAAGTAAPEPPGVAAALCAGVFAFRAQLGGLPLPPAHGYSCRQQPITMASALPAGTACPFPSLCSQEAARAPCAASLAPRPPRHLLGGFTVGMGPFPKPQWHRLGWCWVSRVSAEWCQPHFGCGLGDTTGSGPRTPGGGDTSHREDSAARRGTAAPYPLPRSPVALAAV